MCWRSSAETPGVHSAYPCLALGLESVLGDGARDYDPTLGRYVQSDPIGFEDKISSYGYALSRPTMLIDPLGLQSSTLVGPGSSRSMGQLNKICENDEEDREALYRTDSDTCSGITRMRGVRRGLSAMLLQHRGWPGAERAALSHPWPLGTINMYDYDHLVCVDEHARELVIFRLSENGRKTLLTRATLPETFGWSEELKGLAKELGENLLIDSPSARKLLGI